MLKLKDKYYFWRQKRRYKKFKNCSLPYPFWDKRRDTFEWVYYDEINQLGYNVNSSLYEVLGDVSISGLTYDYEAFMFGRIDLEQKEPKYQMIEGHCHSFDEIVRCVYNYPESFCIPDKYMKEYSEQELRCLKKMQSYLRAIGLTDKKESKEIIVLNEKWERIYNKTRKNLKDKLFLIRYDKKFEKLKEQENLKRCVNEKALLYSSYYPLYTSKKGVAEAYLNGQKDYVLRRQYSFNKKTNIGNRYMLVNVNNEYSGTLEVVSEEFIPFKELKTDMVNYKLAGYKTFFEYKEHLQQEYLEDSKFYGEEFTENSLLVYLKVKVLEKF